jgi:tRNA dimethylallyltransferase
VHGAPFLHGRLTAIDPVAAAKIAPGDAKRIIRALEVHAVTGRPMSAFHTPEGVHGIPRPNTRQFGLAMDRERLYRRIDARVDAMLAAGFVEEVRGLLDVGYGPQLKAMQSLGYRHLAAYMRGEGGREQAVGELKRDTRRYAKRQLSWFHADPNVAWLDVDEIGERHQESTAPRAETAADVLAQYIQTADKTDPPGKDTLE